MGPDITALLWNVSGDMDFPKDKYILMVQALTGTEFDTLTHQIKIIPKDEWEKIHGEYLKIAREHAKTCKYPRQNVYLRFLREEKE